MAKSKPKNQRKIEEVTQEIISLGNQLDWFVSFIPGVTINDYIFSDKSGIYVDLQCFKLYKNNTTKFSHNDLADYLKEVLTKTIDNPDGYYITVEDSELPF